MSESGSRSTIFVVCSLTHCGPMSVTLHAAEFEWVSGRVGEATRGCGGWPPEEWLRDVIQWAWVG